MESSSREVRSRAWGCAGNTETFSFFRACMESVKGLVEDKPGKSEQGVGIEHPSAKSRHLD